MGYPSQTQRCWRNGNVFRRRPRTETIARLEKWVIVGSSVLACLVDSGLKPNPKPSTKCNLICNYVMWWQTDPLSGFCRSFSSLVCFGGSIDVSKHWNKPGPTLQALTVNMHTRNGKWNAFIWEVEEEFSSKQNSLPNRFLSFSIFSVPYKTDRMWGFSLENQIACCCYVPAEGTVFPHIGTFRTSVSESSERPRWLPSMGDTDGNTSISTYYNAVSILNTSYKAVKASWREAAKVTCCV